MRKRSSEDIDIDIKNQLEEILAAKQSHLHMRSPVVDSPASYRFGMALLVLAVFCLVAGLYQRQTDAFYHLTFFCFGLLLMLIGAWHIERSLPVNRIRNESKDPRKATSRPPLQLL